MTWTPTGAGSYIKFSGAADAEKNNLIDSAKSGTPTFASGDVTVPVNTGAAITNIVRNTTAGTFGNVALTGIDAVDTAAIQGGDYLKGDAVNLNVTLGGAITLTGNFVFTIPYIRKSASYPGAGASEAIFDEDYVMLVGSTSSGTSLYLGNGTSFVVTALGITSLPLDVVSVLVARRVGTTVTFEIDGVVKGTSTAVGNDLSLPLISSTMFLQRQIANQPASGILGVCTLEDGAAGVTYKWDFDAVTDNGGGTGNVPQTGTGTLVDATVNNFVAATDIVTVPNNTFSYALSEGVGSTLGSTPSGKNITLVNNPTWS
jgi:hypothetical protein